MAKYAEAQRFSITYSHLRVVFCYLILVFDKIKLVFRSQETECLKKECNNYDK